MGDTKIFKCTACLREWEDYEDKYTSQMRKCSICLAPICLKCHLDKTKKQHCFSCEYPKGKNKEEVKQERKERYKQNKCINKMLKDLDSGSNIETAEASNITITPVNFNFMRF